jgi:hypothetical protein
MALDFGHISTEECVNVTPPPDTRCSDPAFALANPDVCPPVPVLAIKPAVAMVCALHGEIQFRAFVSRNGVEEEVTDRAVFTSSNLNVLVVGAIGGTATGLATGEATVTVTYEDMSAFAQVSVLAAEDDCCENITISVLVLLDVSRSMSQSFGAGYSSRLAFGKQAAFEFISGINFMKDSVGLMTFDKVTQAVLSPIALGNEASLDALADVAQGQQLTAFTDAVTLAVSTLQAYPSDRKILLIISDGADTTTAYTEGDNPVQVIDDFKQMGGIVMALGTRSSDRGYGLLSRFSTGGMFVNAYADNAARALAYVKGLKGYLCAGNCQPVGDEYVPTGQLDYSAFTNWNVDVGNVDLIGAGFIDLLPGNGLYVDMAGTTAPNKGRLTLKVPLAVTAGRVYRLTIKAAGNQRVAGSPNTIRVQVTYPSGISTAYHLNNKVTIDDYTQGFKPYSWSFTAPNSEAVTIVIQQTDTIEGEDAIGLLVDSIKFEDVTNGTTVFEDTFDTENQVYVPPLCGVGTTWVPLLEGGMGYMTGTACYGDECLTEPPDAQKPDPDPLPDIESGWTPPKIFTGAKVACAECASGSTNISKTSAVPPMTAYTLPSGEASASSEDDDTTAYNPFATDSGGGWQSDPSQPFPAWLMYEFDVAATVSHFGLRCATGVISADGDLTLIDWELQGSNGGDVWVPLHAATTGLTCSGDFDWAELLFEIESPAAYKFYRLYLAAGNAEAYGCDCAFVQRMNLYVAATQKICLTGTGTSTVSQSDADDAAYADGLTKAQAQLNCKPIYSSTQSYTAKCPAGVYGADVTKSATVTSLISQSDANTRALDIAKAEAEAVLDCEQSSSSQKILLLPGGAGIKPASIYPSVQFSEETGIIASLVLRINGFTHTYPKALRMALRSPTGTVLEFWRHAGGPNPNPGLPQGMIFTDTGTFGPYSCTLWSGQGDYTVSQYADNCSSPGSDASVFPAPFPLALGALLDNRLFAAFTGESPYGAWSLWVIDELGTGSGEIDSWELEITLA